MYVWGLQRGLSLFCFRHMAARATCFRLRFHACSPACVKFFVQPERQCVIIAVLYSPSVHLNFQISDEKNRPWNKTIEWIYVNEFNCERMLPSVLINMHCMYEKPVSFTTIAFILCFCFPETRPFNVYPIFWEKKRKRCDATTLFRKEAIAALRKNRKLHSKNHPISRRVVLLTMTMVTLQSHRF